LEVGDGRPLVGPGELEGHEEVRGLADAAGDVVLERDDGRPPRARGDRYVVEAELPGVVQIERPAEADAAVHAEEALPGQGHVEDGEEVLVPADGDPVLADAAEA